MLYCGIEGAIFRGTDESYHGTTSTRNLVRRSVGRSFCMTKK
jgi:hypothetical protein